MKMDFPKGMPVWEQLIRASGRKRVGRKHRHTVGPGRAKSRNWQTTINKKAKAFSAALSAYWRGDKDEHP